ncbi:MAG TPA: hypothetical protein VJ801_08965 [Polyangia bacterium]|jgi:hypothetical protein|nr:hypothetical protein [Polyangia bacterium]
MGELDITPGWQHRMAELRRIVRDCQHAGQRLRNGEGQLFCADCGRHLNDDGTEA